MSVVVAQVTENYHTLAADSAVSTGNFVNTNSVLKIHDCTPEISVGFCGNPELVTMFKVFMETHPLPAAAQVNETEIYYYMSTFYNEASTKGFSFQDQHEEESISILELMFITPYKVISVQRFFIQEISEFYAIGSGAETAITALHLGKNATEAAETACRLNPWCEFPIVVAQQIRKNYGGYESNRQNCREASGVNRGSETESEERASTG